MASCDSLLAKFPLSSDRSSINDLVRYMDPSFQHYTFNPTDGTVKAIINSSSFDLITNDTLRRHLISWDGLLSDYTEGEKAAENLLEEVYSFLRMNTTKRTIYSEQNLSCLLYTSPSPRDA